MVLDPPSREAYVRRAARLYIIFPRTWNAYAYVGNQPLANVDPLGLRQCATHNGRCMPTLYGGGGAAADDSLFGPNSDWDVFALMSAYPIWVPTSGTNACIGLICPR